MAFCDFCNCAACQKGHAHLTHAQTEDGRWVCDCCYDYDICIVAWREQTGKNRGPCEGEEAATCPHRPKVVSEWSEWQPSMSFFERALLVAVRRAFLTNEGPIEALAFGVLEEVPEEINNALIALDPILCSEP